MIDLFVNAVMILGIVAVSVPTLLFAVAGIVHMAYGAYRLATSDLT
jgi:hypothetical protein